MIVSSTNGCCPFCGRPMDRGWDITAPTHTGVECRGHNDYVRTTLTQGYYNNIREVAEITKGMFCNLIHELVGLKPVPERIRPITPIKRLTFWDSFFIVRKFC